MSNETDEQKCVTNLVKRADAATQADDALKYSQAACNAANALRVLADIVVKG
jgi:hypothetical protein